jgi:hypothetical protein
MEDEPTDLNWTRLDLNAWKVVKLIAANRPARRKAAPKSEQAGLTVPRIIRVNFLDAVTETHEAKDNYIDDQPSDEERIDEEHSDEEQVEHVKPSF